MANKTVVWTISGLVGETGLSLLIFAEGGNTVLNGSGDTLTNSSYGRLTCTVTEALAAGWYDAVVIDGASNLVTERGPDAKLYLPGDIAGTYTVGSLSVPTTQIVTGRIPRAVGDTEPIIFPWSSASASLSGTRAIGTESPVALVGLITFLYTLNGQHVYSLAYDAADRPTAANSVIYRITNGSEYGYIILDVYSSATPGNATSYEIVVSDADNTPIPHCSCWVATDEAGADVVSDIFETDSFGKVNFVLVPGTYWLFRQKNGVTFTVNPRELTVV